MNDENIHKPGTDIARVDSPAPFETWLDYEPGPKSDRTVMTYRSKGAPPPADWQPVFLDALSRTGNVTTASEAAGLRSTLPYFYRKNDPRFATAWRIAFEEGVDRVEQLLQNDMVDPRNPMRTTAKIFWLKSRRPDVFGDKIAHTGDAGGSVPPSAMVSEMRAALGKLRETERALPSVLDAVVVDDDNTPVEASGTTETNSDPTPPTDSEDA